MKIETLFIGVLEGKSLEKLKKLNGVFMGSKYYLYVGDICKINLELVIGSHKFSMTNNNMNLIALTLIFK